MGWCECELRALRAKVETPSTPKTRADAEEKWSHILRWRDVGMLGWGVGVAEGGSPSPLFTLSVPFCSFSFILSFLFPLSLFSFLCLFNERFSFMLSLYSTYEDIFHSCLHISSTFNIHLQHFLLQFCLFFSFFQNSLFLPSSDSLSFLLCVYVQLPSLILLIWLSPFFPLSLPFFSLF